MQPRSGQTRQHEGRLLWLFALFLLSLSSCRWFTAPRPAQTRTRSLQHAAPPADNSTGFCACTLYLVFKEPTPAQAGNPLLAVIPQSIGPFLGEPSKVTTEDLLCQPRQKNLLRLVSRSNVRRPRRGFASRMQCLSQYTRSGWAFQPTSATRRQRILAEQALPATEPRARYLTCVAAADIRRPASQASSSIREWDEPVKSRAASHRSSRCAVPADLCAAQSPNAQSHPPS